MIGNSAVRPDVFIQSIRLRIMNIVGLGDDIPGVRVSIAFREDGESGRRMREDSYEGFLRGKRERCKENKVGGVVSQCSTAGSVNENIGCRSFQQKRRRDERRDRRKERAVSAPKTMPVSIPLQYIRAPRKSIVHRYRSIAHKDIIPNKACRDTRILWLSSKAQGKVPHLLYSDSTIGLSRHYQEIPSTLNICEDFSTDEDTVLRDKDGRREAIGRII